MTQLFPKINALQSERDDELDIIQYDNEQSADSNRQQFPLLLTGRERRDYNRTTLIVLCRKNDIGRNCNRSYRSRFCC
jgi:hypothetical protein